MTRDFAAWLACCALAFGCTVSQDLGARHELSTPDGGTGGEDDGFSKGSFVFSTENLYTGDLKSEGGGTSGADGADRICMREAIAAGLKGTYRAWISTSTENAIDRIAPTGPWYLADRETVIFPGSAISGSPRAYMSMTPSGDGFYASDHPEVWTGTLAEGTISSRGTCSDWESNDSSESAQLGFALSHDSGWTEPLFADPVEASSQSCAGVARLYCFGQ